jgi:prephenate dehydrogenase
MNPNACWRRCKQQTTRIKNLMAAITVAIIGLNRVGASVGLAIKRYMKAPGAEHQITVVGADESPETRALAKKKEAIDIDARNVGVAVEAADLVFLAIPYGKYDEYYEAIAADIKHGAVIIDFSPLKQAGIQRAYKHLPRDADGLAAFAIGATAVLNPLYMFDTTTATQDARPDLFEKGTMILSPDSKVRGEAIQLVADFAALLGMTAHFTDPAEHDGLIAAMEALPLLSNLALFRSVNKNAAWDDLRRMSTPVFGLSSFGLAHYTAEDAAATLRGNRDHTLRYLNDLIDNLTQLRELVKADDISLLTESFAETRDQHGLWLSERRQAMWDAPGGEQAVDEKITVGSMLRTRLFGRLGQMGQAAKKEDK